MSNSSHDFCLFCAVGQGEKAEQFVWQDDRVVAFLDLRPIRPGHVLVIPREHHPYFVDLPEPLLAHIAVVGQKLARVVQELSGVERIAFAFSGGDVAHAHAHVFPIHESSDMTSGREIVQQDVTFAPRPKASDEERSRWAERICAGLAEAGFHQGSANADGAATERQRATG
ncbi:HIT family protein [Altericroceibacterium xinjiangense]|uniref:HIT family protein n=1 Tax=Altericroceibacterium xinjiangense TaxID=762261 RepID=UPI000F7E1101|nr:HIT family protein [Altericroceibacterium xinjiangense]